MFLGLDERREENKKRNLSKNKASPVKALLSEKLDKIERVHQPDTSIVCLSNTIKTDNIYIV